MVGGDLEQCARIVHGHQNFCAFGTVDQRQEGLQDEVRGGSRAARYALETKGDLSGEGKTD